MMNGDRRQYVITKLPQYLIIHIKRFSKNTQQYVEKNPTIVNFPVRPRASTTPNPTPTPTPNLNLRLD